MEIDQQINSPFPTQQPTRSPKHFTMSFILIGCCVGILIIVPSGLLGYQIGTHNSHVLVRSTPAKSLPQKKKTVQKQVKKTTSNKQFASTVLPGKYTVLYTIPAGWRPMIWHVTPYGAENAILPPDYTSLSDPVPQTGMSIVIFQFPDEVSDMKHLRPIVEQTEDGLQHLSQTTVGGYPAWYAIFKDTDSNLILYDYHILKGNDHWVVRFIFPGNSLVAAQEEEQKYNYQINEFMQSLQFKKINFQ